MNPAESREAAARTAASDMAFDSEEPQAVWRFLDDAYGASLRIEGDPGRLTFDRVDLGLLAVDEMDLGGRVSFDTDPITMFNVLECRGGHGGYQRLGMTDRFGVDDVVATSVPGHGYAGFCGPVRIRVLNLDLQALTRAAVEIQGSDSPLRFRRLRTTRRRDALMWSRLVDFVQVAAQRDRAHRGGLTDRELVRLVARTALDVFPNSTWDEPAPGTMIRDGRDASAQAVRRATTYIDSTADQDLGLADIAAAAHVSTRALQAGFRRHLDTTPMRYLQRARLQQARHDLLAPHAETTVASVASRWGFHNHGRFAALYRQEFEELPSATLARADGGVRVAERGQALE